MIRQKGSVLILALWTLIFLSLLAVVFGYTAMQQMVLTDKIEERKQLYDVAYAGTLLALETIGSNMQKDTTPEADSLNDFWSNNPQLFMSRTIGDGRFSFQYDYKDNIYGYEHPWFGVTDEERRLNINYVDRDVLYALLVDIAAVEQAKAWEIANAIVDWRDPDDVLYNEKNNQSERAYYISSAKGYVPRNTYFSDPCELMLVKGMDADIFCRIRDYITVYGNGKINLNTVSLEVLVALGLDRALAKKIILFRSGLDRKEGSVDDNMFFLVQDIMETLEARYALSDIEKDEITALSSMGLLDVKSETFRILCTAELDRSKVYGKIICIFEKNGDIKYIGYSIEDSFKG